MPARVNKIRHDEETRAKIQAAQIINRFMDCLNGDIELSPSQVSVGKTLLAKVLPDLSSVDMQANVDGQITIQVLRLADNPASSE